MDQQKDEQAKRPAIFGVCRKFFSFFMKHLAFHSAKPVILGTSNPKPPTGGVNGESTVIQVIDIVVEGGETKEETAAAAIGVDQEMDQKSSAVSFIGEGSKGKAKAKARKRPPMRRKEPPSAQEVEDEVAKKKDGGGAGDTTAGPDKVVRPLQPVLPRLSANIDEKSDAFIQSKKESLRTGSKLQPIISSSKS